MRKKSLKARMLAGFMVFIMLLTVCPQDMFAAAAENGEIPTSLGESDAIAGDSAVTETDGKIPAEQLGNTPIENLSDTPTEQLGNTPAENLGDAPADKPGDVPADKPGDEPADKPGDAPTDKPGDVPADKPGDAPADKPGDVPADKPGDAPTDKPDEVPTDKPDEAPADETDDASNDEQNEVSDDISDDTEDDEQVQEQSYKDAQFSIIWSDQKDLAQRRPESIYDLIELYADGEQLEDTDFTITLNKTEENPVYDFEILSYTISKLPVYQEDMETEINYTLRQDVTEPGNVLPGYDALDKSILEEAYAASDRQELTPEEVLDTLAEPDAEVKLQSGEESYNAEKSFANYLPVYKTSGSITWPEGVDGQDRPAIKEYFEQYFSISLNGNHYGLASVDSSADKENADVWHFSVKNLFTTDEKGNAVQYKLIPKQLDGFTLDREDDTVAGNSTDFNFIYAYAQQAVMPLEAKEAEVIEKISKNTKIVWFDTVGEDRNAHPGELTLGMDYTVDGKETEITFTWNSESNQYEYHWTEADKAALSLPDEYPSLVLKDEGANSLNRTLSVENLPSMIQAPTGEMDENGNPVTEEINVGWSEIRIDKVNFTSTDKVHHYDISEKDGIYTLMPMREMVFYQDTRSGNDNPEMQHEYLMEYVKAAFKLKVAQDGSTEIGSYEWGKLIDNLGEDYLTIDKEDYSLKLCLPVYSLEKKELIYAVSFDNTDELNKKLLENEGYYYRIEYDNTQVPGHGSDISQTYADGKVILIKTGEKNYEAQKYWHDEFTAEEAEEKRPDAVYRLYRYVDNGQGNYKTASQITLPGEHGEVSEWPMPKMAGKDPTAAIPLEFQNLPKYNSDGYEYIYFIRETLPGDADYEKIYGIVDENGNVSNDVLPKHYVNESEERADDDTSVYDGGIISNRKTDSMTVTAKKEWKAAHYQDELENIEVDLTLYARRKNVHDEGENDDWYEVKTVTLDGFSAMYNSQTVSEGVNKYDAQGHELEYMWVETGVRQKNAGDTAYLKNGKETTIDKIIENVLKANGRVKAKDADSGEDSFEYRLPVNLDSIQKDSCEHSDEYFISTTHRNGNTTVITNELKGVTDYYVKKIWKDMEPGDITVDLIRTDAADNHEKIGNYTIKADGKDTYVKDADGNWTTNWINAFPKLPRYDENGNLYTYKVVEHGGNGHYSYGYDVDNDEIIEENSTQIVNTPPPEGENNISLRKVWLDDSVETGRGTVYAAIYTEDMTLLYGTLNQDDEEVKGILSPDFVEISEMGNWRREVNVAVYTKNGKYSAMKTDDTWELYKGAFLVTEVRIGTNEVSDTETAGEYHTVTNNGTTYAVLYYVGKNDGTTTYNPYYTKTPDENGDYVLTNLRIGTVDLEVNKHWVDNVKEAERPEEVYFKLNCEEYKDAVADREGKGYVEIPHSLNGEQKILDQNGNHVSSEQKLQSTKREDKTDWVKEEIIYFYNLPQYDSLGRIIHYQVTEEIKGENHDYAGSLGGVVYDTSDSGSGHVKGSETITNTPSNTENVQFHLLWLDEYRDKNTQRPDIYLTLYYTKWTTQEDGTVTSEVVPYSFKEYLWSDHSENANDAKDCWTYTFYNMPRYDENGNPITYYASLATHADRDILDYIDVQYAKGDKVDSLEDFQANGVNQSKVDWDNENGEYKVTHTVGDIVAETPEDSERKFAMQEDNTFVIQLKEDVTVVGEKIWVKLPEGFPVSQLPKLTFNLYQKDPHSEPEDEGRLIATIEDYQSESTRYEFKMHYQGKNSITGESLEQHPDDPDYKPLPLPKYDENGARYLYEVIETIATNQDGKVDIAYENLNGSVSGYNITNTYNTTTENTRPIELTKNWKEKDENGEISDVDGEFDYPNTTYTLYRFYMNTVIGEDGKTYADPEAVKQVTLTDAQAKRGDKVDFGEQFIYAPNGKPYIYYVQETSVKGYDVPTLTLKNVTPVEKVSGFPENVGTDWFTQAFTLEQVNKDDGAANPDASKAAISVSGTNTYTGGEDIDITGSKVWNDYNDAFGIRPTTLNLTLSRQAEGIAKQEMAEITLDISNDVDEENPVTLKDGITNLQGDVTYTVTSNGNTWNYTIKGLDAYASNGKAWTYSVKETAPDNYKAQTGEVSGATVESTGLSNLVNNNYTSLTAKKTWVGLNTGIHMPEVEVKLQVQYKDTWYWADTFFADKSHTVDYSPVTKTLNNGNGWTAQFNNLPEGYMNGNTYTKFVYRVMETKIGDQPVKFNGTEYQTNSDGTVGVTVNGTFYAIETANNPNNTISTVTNTPEGKTKLTVTKKWEEDSNNAYGTRGDQDTDNATTWSVNYYIYRTYTNGTDENVKEQVMRPDGTTKYVLTVSGKDKETTKTAELDNLPASTPDGKAYTYYAVEIDPATGNEIGTTETPNGIYNGSYEVTGNGSSTVTDDNFTTTVTNKLITVDLKVTKTWEDSNFANRPNKLTFRLYQKVGTNGAETDITEKYVNDATMTEKDGKWELTYTKLPKYAPDGTEYVYRAAESRQDGYEDPTHGNTVTKDGNDSPLDKQTEGITNTITEFTMDKVDKDTPSVRLNNVTLVFTSTGEINGKYYQLTWTRDADGKESYNIKRGTSVNSCTEDWSGGNADSGTSVVIKGLPVGIYELTSETAPNGYTNKAVGSTFTMNSNGTITTNSNMLSVTNTSLQLQVKNEKTTFSINKVDQNGEALGGWEFSVTGKFRASDSALTNVETRYISKRPENASSGPLLADGDLVAGETYTLKEVVTPDYYVPSTKEVQFRVNTNGSITITNPDTVAGVASVNPVNSSTIRFINVPFEIQLMKKDSEGNKNLDGAVFRLQKQETSASSWSDVTGIPEIKTGENGSIAMNSVTYKLEIGATYRLLEKKAPDGYILPNTMPYAKFTVASDGTLTNTSTNTSSRGDIIFDTVTNKGITVKDAPISIQVVKHDGEYDGSGTTPLKDVTFTLQEKNEQGADDGTPQTATTNADGILTFGPETGANSFKVVGGKTYLMTEHATGYYGISVKVTVNTNGTIKFTDSTGNAYTTNGEGKVVIGNDNKSLTVTNVRKKGSVELIKQDGDDNNKLLDNIQFTLYRKKTDGSWFDKIIDFITGNQYKVSDTFDWDGATSGNAYDSVEKSDTGKLLITGLEWGDYKLVETAADGYVLPGDEYTFTVNAANVDSLLPLKVGTNGFVTNYQNRLTIQKIDSENDNPLQGAAFELYQVKDGKETLYASSSAVGTWELKKLPVGDYKLKETVSPDGYALPDGEKAILRFKVKTDGTIEKISDSEYYEITIGTADGHGVCQNTIKMKDQKIKAQILKADEKGNGYLEGTEFTVKPKTAEDRFTSEADSITINKDNYTTVLDGELVCGKNYTITETIAPNGYTLPETTFTLAVDANGTISVTADESAKLNGAAISAVANPWVIKVTDKPLNVHIKKVDDRGKAVENAEFTLTDGTDKWTLKSDEKGFLHWDGHTDAELMKELHVGESYTLTETMPEPSPYVELATEVIVEIQNDGTLALKKGTDVASLSDNGLELTITNTRTSFTLDKVDGDDAQQLNKVSLTFKGKKETLTEEWSLVWTRNAKGRESYSVSKNGTEIYTGKSDGQVTIMGLPAGTYELTEETKLPNGYISAAELGYTLTIAKDGTVSVSGDGIGNTDNAVIVKDKKQSLRLQKAGAEDQEIEGSSIMVFSVTGAFRRSDNTHTNAKAVRYITAENNTLPDAYADKALKDGELIAGNTYTLQEVTAPAGYILSDAKVTFTMEEDGTVRIIDGAGVSQTVSGEKNVIRFKNEPFTVELHKVDSEKEVLPGAEFTLEKYVDEEWEMIEKSLITDDKGMIKLYSLDYALEANGRYRLTETKAPDGYILDTTPVEFGIDSKGHFTGAAGIKDDVMEIVNKPISIKLVKLDGGDGCDDGGILANVEFTLTDKDGKEQKAVTDSDGKLTFGNKAGDNSFFVIGGQTYTLTETKKTGYYNLGSVEVKVGTDGMITLSNGKNSFTSADGSVITVENADAEVTNKRIAGSVTLTKIDSENEDALNGITFTLYKKNEGGWFDKFVDFITGNSYTLTTEFKWGDTTAADGGIQVETAENGTLTISGLDWGVYKLVETAADGYILSGDEADRTYEFTIDAEQAEKGTYLLAGNGIIKNDPNHLEVWKADKEDHSRRLTGAVYELYYTADSNGKEVNEPVDEQHWNWNSETGVGTANRLRPGTYTLVETQSPEGYKIAPDLVFVMDEQGIVTSDGKPFENQLIYAEDEKTRFSFDKKGLINESCADTTLGNKVPDPEETKLLAGVEFTAYRDETLTEPVMAAESDRDGVVTFIGLPLGSYYIKETKAPSGYVLDDTVYTVTITSKDDAVLMYDGQKVADNTLVNDVYRADISFTKVSELNKKQIIPGGVYGLYKDGILIAKCTSDEKGLVAFEGVLMDETYTVRELSVPGGSYVSSNEVKFTFTVDKNGNPVLSALDDGKGTLERTEQGLLWLEPQTVVEILKTDDKGKALAGATLRILDSKGKVVGITNEKGEKFTTWVTTKEALVITGCLEAGQTYYLEEVKAPKGYKLAKRVKFTLEDSAEPHARKTVSIKMVDEQIIENVKPGGTKPGNTKPGNTKSGGVKTGDMQNPLMYLLALAASAVMWLGFWIFGRKRKENMR